ncbi:DUF4038 domain-containing protein [Parabacteroides distasonis]|jgi:hypothetical protein|uniref:apiosidase-like domain-containing protein n=2 Tax=Parabacteroides distasonis TaxID=823 RepID=UPI0018AC1626|nr:DUF4038 domain-containing protein [Parabacteroides distasonis]MDB9025983.1 DUF4038 domain-containing protein [Parabacteroides distasonis]MDB9042478.1 DUF4038 domain-containing protein [Parabacteroides distasonis]MDB9160795.1 DUF4038 domain-containing protein [Parabacteroides distasonis]
MRRTWLTFLLLLMPLFGLMAQVIFPIQKSANKRYFVDQNNMPFLYNADTGWYMFWKLSEKEAGEYIRLRKAQRFNVIQTMLVIPNSVNVYGLKAFKDNNDFTTLNEAYFDHVDRVLAEAEKENMLIAIAPLWIGCCLDGWGGDGLYLEKNSLENIRFLGEFIGRRFAAHQNVIWILGGDNDPGVHRICVEVLAKAIKKEAPHQMQTYHASSTHSSTDIWMNVDWLDFSMVYTYFRGFNKAWNCVQQDVYEVCYAEYKKAAGMPFILGESTYEGEHGDWGNDLQVRKQAWWAVLSGAAGHAYGSPNWKMIDGKWKDIMKYPGANSLRHFYNFLSARKWYELIPDFDNNLAIDGAAPYATNDYAVSAVSFDKKWAVMYIPSKRTIRVNLKILKGNRISLRWYNPRTGNYKLISSNQSPCILEYTSPDENDWVLLFETK